MKDMIGLLDEGLEARCAGVMGALRHHPGVGVGCELSRTETAGHLLLIHVIVIV